MHHKCFVFKLFIQALVIGQDPLMIGGPQTNSSKSKNKSKTAGHKGTHEKAMKGILNHKENKNKMNTNTAKQVEKQSRSRHISIMEKKV